MTKVAWGLSGLLFLIGSLAGAQTQAQLQCESAATSGYEYCLQHGIPCIPGFPNCTPHKGSPAQCLPVYNAAYQRCQPSFNWTQIVGPTANSAWPPARAWAAYWTDVQGNFWLFGGDGLNTPAGVSGTAFSINDFWKFTPGTSPQHPGAWTLIGGSNQPQMVNTTSMPGGRQQMAFTTDAQGNFWLFGGAGFNGPGKSFGLLNDLWRYAPGTGGTAGTWTMISGQNLVNQRGNYGTQGTPSTNNVPSGRFGSACWWDSNGNFWLFGGVGFSAQLGPGEFFLNDLWEYSPSANTWTWVSGARPTPGMPVGRAGASYWNDGKGNLWIFGGYGFDATGTLGPMNDLWSFNSATGRWSLVSGSATVGSNGNYGQQGIPSANSAPPARSLATWWTDSQGNFWLFGGTNFDLFIAGASFPPLQDLFNDVWEFKPTSNTWIWIGGAQGTGSAVAPGARTGAAGWPRFFPNAWLFGGIGVDSRSFSFSTLLFDLWDGNGTVY